MQISFAALSCSNLAALSCSNLAAHCLLQPCGSLLAANLRLVRFSYAN